ncbi:Hint domain-containing protein [Actibacterium ureilyticum]|uniref:Hint domain-containing protein n=1 Tax=Actibacterium ureilyticum TaxID=1590614 RepID=UPI001594FD2E|nr:Hint domain-containing protein [Actibacterium ureilyticum]
MVSFAVSGADVIQGGNINTNSTGGSNGLGEVTFSSGTAVFEPDDIILIEVVNASADGEIVNGSAISDLTVFDSYADYQAWLDSGSTDGTLIKYNYQPQNPGQTATVQSDISGLGDSYVRFNANVLIPTDGGPTLNNTLTIAPGTNLATNGGASVTLDRVRDFDLDYDETIDSGTIEVGNSNFYIGDYVEILNGGPLCWTRGARVDTPAGLRPIETLAVGDLVNTLDHGPRPVRWVAHRRVPARDAFAPVHFAAGAIGNDRPFELSRNHRILFSGAHVEFLFDEPQVLVAAKHLVNGDTIRLRQGGTVDYYHLMFDRHEIIFVDGLASESLLSGPASLNDRAAQAELQALFPGLVHQAETAQAARLCLRKPEAAVLMASPAGLDGALRSAAHSPRHRPLRAAS